MIQEILIPSIVLGLGALFWFWMHRPTPLERERARQKRDEERANPMMLTVSPGVALVKGELIKLDDERQYTIAEVESMGLAKITLAKRPWWKFWRRK